MTPAATPSANGGGDDTVVPQDGGVGADGVVPAGAYGTEG